MKNELVSLHIINGDTQMLDFCLGRCKSIHQKMLSDKDLYSNLNDENFYDNFYTIDNGFAISVYGNRLSSDNIQELANVYFHDFDMVYVLTFSAFDNHIILSLCKDGRIKEELSVHFQKDYKSYQIVKNTIGKLFEAILKITNENLQILLAGKNIDDICTNFSELLRLPLTLTYDEISKTDELTKNTDEYGVAYLKYRAEFHSFCLI